MTLGLGIGLKLIFTVYDIGLILIHDIDLILIWYWSGIDLVLIWYWSGIDPGIGLILILILIWYWLDIEKWINPQDWKNQLLRLKKINFNIIDQDWSGLIFFNPGSSGKLWSSRLRSFASSGEALKLRVFGASRLRANCAGTALPTQWKRKLLDLPLSFKIEEHPDLPFSCKIQEHPDLSFSFKIEEHLDFPFSFKIKEHLDFPFSFKIKAHLDFPFSFTIEEHLDFPFSLTSRSPLN